ncbi:MAG: phytanoyl-CoA dioxygenase family protein [Gammaproteobacteria bacterium]
MKLDETQLEHFEREGYLVVENALEAGDLDPVIEEYESYIDLRARELKSAGKITDLFEGESFTGRLARICEQHNDLFSELDIMVLRGRASFEFLANDNLLDMVESFVGPEIICSPIQHIRAKLPTPLASGPSAEATHVAPWHQDAGVTWEEADPYFILTVWIPFVESTAENGCMQILPRQHKTGLKRHETLERTGTTIVADEMPAAEPLILPMKKGSVLFLHKQTPHRSTPNLSSGVRWSADLRYQKTGTPTGRPFRPHFVVRSRSEPSSVLTDHGRWSDLWREALAKSAGTNLHRWGPPTPADAEPSHAG